MNDPNSGAQRFKHRGLERSREVEGAGPEWLEAFRSGGRATFERTPLPGRKTEAWKYTDIRPLLEEGLLDPALSGGRAPAPEALPELGARRVVLVDGRLDRQASSLGADEGVEVLAFTETTAGSSARQALDAHLGSVIDVTGRPFAALNASSLEDGVIVHVRRNAAPAAPLHLVLAGDGRGRPCGVHPRLLIVLDAGAELTLVEHYLGDAEVFTNAVVEVALGENAHLEHRRLQLERAPARHVGSLGVRLGGHARYGLDQVSFGAALKRNEIRVSLEGEGGEVRLGGAFVTREGAHVDNQVCLEHAVPHCTSNEIFRGIAGEKGQAVFNGRIHIHPGAQHAEAELSSKNLLLTADAEIDAKPELEIYADDVKCAHGATVGSIDETALYYLRTRGVGESAARALLAFGFLQTVLDGVAEEALRDWLRPRLVEVFARDEATRRLLS